MGQEPSQIRQEIEETRAEMGDTVDALAYKTDVKTRVKESFSDKRERLIEQVQGTKDKVGGATPDGHQVKEGAQQAVGVAQENPLGLAIGGIAAGFLAGMLLPKRVRRRSSAAARLPAKWPSRLSKAPKKSARRRWTPPKKRARSRPRGSKTAPKRARRKSKSRLEPEHWEWAPSGGPTPRKFAVLETPM